MAFTSTFTTDDIIVQEGTFAFDYDASGTVYGGQGVYAIGTMQVKAPAASVGHVKGCVGVAAYQIADGNPVAVYGPGNIVRVCVSSTSVAAGDPLFLYSDGTFYETAAPCLCCSGVSAIALEANTTAHGACRVMLH